MAAGISFKCERTYDTDEYIIRFSNGYNIALASHRLFDMPADVMAWGPYYAVLWYASVNFDTPKDMEVVIREAMHTIRKQEKVIKFSQLYAASQDQIKHYMGDPPKLNKWGEDKQHFFDDIYKNDLLVKMAEHEQKKYAKELFHKAQQTAMYEQIKAMQVSQQEYASLQQNKMLPLLPMDEYIYKKYTAKLKPAIKALYLLDLGDGILVPKDYVMEVVLPALGYGQGVYLNDFEEPTTIV